MSEVHAVSSSRPTDRRFSHPTALTVSAVALTAAARMLPGTDLTALLGVSCRALAGSLLSPLPRKGARRGAPAVDYGFVPERSSAGNGTEHRPSRS